MKVWRKEAHPHLLPWLGTGRLDANEARRVEEHLAQCEECTEVAASLASMGGSLRAASAEHIGGEELVMWAEGRIHGEPARCARIEVHLAGCAECRDDLAALRLTGIAEPAPGRARRPSVFSRIAALSAAAGLLLGIGIGAMIWRTRTGVWGVEGAGDSSWAGPTVLVLLPGPLRGGSPPVVTHRAKSGEERVVFAFPSLDSGFRDQEGLYRFEIYGESSGSVLSQTMSGADARHHIDAARVIAFDLPADRLVAERLDCRVIAPDGNVLYEASVDLEHSD